MTVHLPLTLLEFEYLSQYRHDYPPRPLEGRYGPNMDSVRLRQSHFALGDYVLPYRTSSMDQSKDILTSGAHPAFLDEKVKSDLRRSHFVFGNSEPNFQSQNQRDYYDKFNLLNRDGIDSKSIERNLRATNYVLGDDTPVYISETADKFTKPKIDPNYYSNDKKISTAELQRSHYVFGNSKVPWVTTQQLNFGPKKVEQKLVQKNLTKTNFILGEDTPTLKSVNEETYIRHPIVYNPIDKKSLNDLRSHHFILGNDDYPSQLTSVNNQTYTKPVIDGNASYKKIDSQILRASHWDFGDNHETANEHYATTYGLTMQPKKRILNDPIPNSTFKTSFSITGTYPNTYSTEARSNYKPMSRSMNPEELRQMQKLVKNIKSSHFELGELPIDYGTTMGNAYKFDPQSAKNARGALDRALLNDLRSTHYKLGYDIINNVTTNRADYVPKKLEIQRAKDPNLRKSHFELGNENEIQDGKTIYMTDYVPKPLPIEEDDDE